jgi:hypothetical protein
MTRQEAIRFAAARVLSIGASDRHAMLEAIAFELGVSKMYRAAAIRLARATLSLSGGAGNWREARAEAEARLRCAGPGRGTRS